MPKYARFEVSYLLNGELVIKTQFNELGARGAVVAALILGATSVQVLAYPPPDDVTADYVPAAERS